MKLLVDLGNSRLKWAYGIGERLLESGVLPGPGTADGVTLTMPRPARGERLSEIRISSVAGDLVTQSVVRALASQFAIAPRLVSAAQRFGTLRNGYTDPGQLGVDRWLAMVAVWHRRQAPAVVVDSGTATTVDAVAAGGQHRGGLILPGLALMQTALLGNTGELASRADRSREVGTAVRAPAFAMDTASAMRLAALRATVAMVAASFRDLACADARIVVTGGASQVLCTELVGLGLPVEHRPMLVLEGLAIDPDDG